MSSAAGAKVGLVELPYNAVSSATQGGLGGTCVIRGCVPKKLLVFGAQFEAEFRDARGFGWDHGESMPSFSWEKLISAKTDEIERLNGIYGRILDNNGVEKFEGAGKVTGPHSVEVTAADGSKTTYTAKNILLAPGGRAWYPAIPGADYGITSDEALALQTQPKRVLVVGGGYIAVEFAGIFQGFGSETTIAFRADLPLRGFDEEVRQTVANNLESRGMNVMKGVNPTKIVKNDDGSLVVSFDGDVGHRARAQHRPPGPRSERGGRGAGLQGRGRGGRLLADHRPFHLGGGGRHEPHEPHAGGAHGGHGVQGHGGAREAH
jgi:glutathione reductase (NADPH)